MTTNTNPATPVTLFGSCDLCAEVYIEKPATGERSIAGMWANVCDAHAYRADSASKVAS